MLNQRLRPPPSRDCAGAATLATLMVLLLLMGLTTLLGARLLLGDQLGSDVLVQGQQRLSLHESGLDWGLDLLNGPRRNTACQPLPAGTEQASLPWVEQLTVSDESGLRRVRPAWQGLRFQCVRTDDGWLCQCPNPDGQPGGATAPGAPLLPAPDLRPGFSLAVQGMERPDTGLWHRRTLRLVVQACGQGQLHCEAPAIATSSPLPAASQSQLVTLASALPHLPGSALIGRTTVDLRHVAPGESGLALPPDAHSAWVVQAGGSILGADGHVHGAPGRAMSGLARPEAAELVLSPDAFFARHFGLPPTAYQDHPGLTTLDCSDQPDCAPLLDTHLKAGHRWLWIKGPLRLHTAVTLGQPDRPVLLICDSALEWTAPVQMNGLVYSHGPSTLQAAGPPLRIEGALLSAEGVVLTGHVQVIYAATQLHRLSDQLGTWVRLPGGWAP